MYSWGWWECHLLFSHKVLDQLKVWPDGGAKWKVKVITTHPEGDEWMNVWTKFHRDPFKSCKDISFQTSRRRCSKNHQGSGILETVVNKITSPQRVSSGAVLDLSVIPHDLHQEMEFAQLSWTWRCSIISPQGPKGGHGQKAPEQLLPRSSSS